MFELKREPTHPGDILQHEFLEPMYISQTALAADLGVTFRTINEIINHKRGISPEMAIRLAKYFGTSEELWLNLQIKHDLYKVKEKKRKILGHIKSYAELHKERRTEQYA